MGWNGGVQWLLEVALVVLLATTLFHALRLERALGVLKRDRSALEALVADFNASTRQAEQGIERLRAAADGAGRQIAKQVDAAGPLQDDLAFLVERGERLADRLDVLVRAGRDVAPDPPPVSAATYQQYEGARVESVSAETANPQAMRLEFANSTPVRRDKPVRWDLPRVAAPEPAAEQPRLRSQAERDLLKALRMAR